MLGVPSPKVDPGRTSGTVIKVWDTLTEIGQTSGATLSVSLAVLATLIVFGRWLRAIPGGLVAVVGTIAVSWGFDLSAHGVSILGPVPSGLPHIGFPSGVSWSNTTGLLATALSMFLVILAQSAATSRAYAVKYKERFVENDDLVGLSAANLAAGFSGTFVVNGSPTKTEMVDESPEPHAGRPTDDRRRRRARAAVSHEAAAVPSERRPRGRGLPNRPEADRHREHARDSAAAQG
jgi:sulfate permease, SulP family